MRAPMLLGMAPSFWWWLLVAVTVVAIVVWHERRLKRENDLKAWRMSQRPYDREAERTWFW